MWIHKLTSATQACSQFTPASATTPRYSPDSVRVVSETVMIMIIMTMVIVIIKSQWNHISFWFEENDGFEWSNVLDLLNFNIFQTRQNSMQSARNMPPLSLYIYSQSFAKQCLETSNLNSFTNSRWCQKGEKSTDRDHNLISSENCHDTSACKISGHSLYVFSRKCPKNLVLSDAVGFDITATW